MVNRFNCLWHHTVISRNNKNNDVSYASTTSTHLGERRVTWCVNECDFLSVFFNLIRTDVLCDAASLASNNICITNFVEKRRLTVVNVTHDRDDRWSCCLQLWRVVVRVIEHRLQLELFLLTWVNKQNLCADFKCE